MLFPEAAIGALSAAIIAGALTLAGLIGGKENKTSEFRQNWIDGLRQDVADFISHVTVIDGMIGVNFADRKDIWEAMRDPMIAMARSSSMIRMRLNPIEPATKKVLNILDQIDKLFGTNKDDPNQKPKAPDRGVVSKKLDELVLEVGVVLKKDWKRVKRGETRYIVAVSAAFLILTLSCGVLLVGSHIFKPHVQKADLSTHQNNTISSEKKSGEK